MPGDGKRRVFLAEDHPLVRDWLTHLIHQQPDLTVCGAAGTAKEALAALRQLQPDLALVEIGIPGSSGLNLIREIRCLAPPTAILVFSTYDESLYAQRAIRAGALAYVNKRKATLDLIPAMQAALHRRRYFSDEFKHRAIEHIFGTGARFGLSALSDRELEIFRLLGQGLQTGTIAQGCHISIKTVQMHCKRMKAKLQLDSGAQLVREATLWWEAQRNNRMSLGKMLG